MGDKLEPNASAARIAGYVPSSDAYLVEFKGDETVQGMKGIISAFLAYSEVRNVSPNFQVKPTAGQWYLKGIGVDHLKSLSLESALPLGSNEIGVAILDSPVNCFGLNCASSPFFSAGDFCLNSYHSANPATNTHGTRVATLVAGPDTPSPNIAGVATGAKLYPFTIASGFELHNGIECARNAQPQNGNTINILNISKAAPDYDELKQSVCRAICDNKMLVVASAGNAACSPIQGNTYPASYDNKATNCAAVGVAGCILNSPPAGASNGILRVGGSDKYHRRGGNIACNSSIGKSEPGEIYAPGWGIPDDNGIIGPPLSNYGTSWATPLVSGCAAVLGAVKKWKNSAWVWNPIEIEQRIRAAARPIPMNPPDPSDGSLILNCLAAAGNPYDVVFVLDRSGSMGLTGNINTNVSANRWEALKSAVSGFASLITQNAPPESRVGFTVFSSKVDMSAGLVDIPPPPAPLPTLSAALSGTAGGATAMGMGLKNGLGTLTNALRPRAIMLFTDGEQNIHTPGVLLDGCTYSDGTYINPASPCTESPGMVRIIAVGIGSPSGNYLTTLQNLASKNRGKFLVTDGVATSGCTGTIDEVFDCAIAPALYGNSPQMVASHAGKLESAKTPQPELAPVPRPHILSRMAPLLAFDINKHIGQLLIKLSLSQKLEASGFSRVLERIKITKDGIDVTENFERVFPSPNTESVLLKANFAFQNEDPAMSFQPEGHYEVQWITRGNEEQVTRRGEPLDLSYRTVVYADDHLLDMDWGVSPAAPRVNQPFAPSVSLNWRGKPVTNAKVEAVVLRPGDDLNDLLAKHPLKVDIVSGLDAGSAGYQKYLHLLENDPEFLAQLQPGKQGFVLIHQGDGQYSAPYNSVSVSGIYQIYYRVIAEDPEFGKIQREAVQSAYVRFGDIDLNKSAVSSIVKGNTVMINFRPITTYGRFIGPAQGSAISVDGVGIKLSSLTDHQDGSYTLVLNGRPDIKVSIKLLGEEIYQGPIASINGNKCCREGENRCNHVAAPGKPPDPCSSYHGNKCCRGSKQR